MAPPSTLKLKYNSASNKLQTTVGLWVDEVKLRLGFSEKALKDVQAAKEELEVAIERPGHFILEHHLHKKTTRFQFHSHAEILNKAIKLTFVHHTLATPVTTIEANVHISKDQRAIVKHNLSKPGPLVKYEYIQDEYLIEPHFDFGASTKAAWGLSVKYGHGKKNFVKATYVHHKKEAELELHKKIDNGGPIKITATIDTQDFKKVPKIVLEKEWKL